MREFHWQVRARAVDRGLADIYVRQHRYRVGVPVQFDANYAEITALEYVLGAVAAEVLNGFRSEARKGRLAVDAAEAHLTGELNNALTYLGVVGEEGHPGIERIELKLFVSSAAPEQALRRAWEDALERLPVVRALRRAVSLKLDMEIVL